MNDSNVSSNLKNEKSNLLFNCLYDSLENISQKYGFVTKGFNKSISLYARNTDGLLTEWIKLEKTQKEIKSILIGNTDHLNLWFYETRKDLTPEVLTSFVQDLNDKIFAPLNKFCKISTLVDPEDWQEIAQVNDAYLDKRYVSNFIDDSDKINDFFRLSKEEFLKSYSYISKEEYYNTVNIINANIDDLYLSFSLKNKNLVAFDLKNSFAGEIKETLELNAYENNCNINDIKISLLTSEEYKKLYSNDMEM